MNDIKAKAAATMEACEAECLTACQGEPKNIIEIEEAVNYDPILITKALYNLTEAGKLGTERQPDPGKGNYVFKMWKAA